MIILDSSFLVAYKIENDEHHEKAKAFMNEIVNGKFGQIFTTDYIFDETVTVTKRKANSKTAAEIGKFLLDSEIFIAKVDQLVFQKAWVLFQDNDLSFTDCSNLAFMYLFSINKIATFDNGFKYIKGVQVIGN